MSDFTGAGTKPGLEIWRIEKMVPKPWADVGKFCTGDSYICLKTSAVPGKSSFTWDIHFWLGSETSKDEAGVAAYKTVELDDLLGGAPTQHREVQGSESDLFLSYFKTGIQYLSGGVESGFTKVERDKYDTRLLHLKGSRSVRVSQVPVAVDSLNSGDVFILDAGLTIWQWNGKDSNKKERAKGLDVTQGIKNDERGGRAKVDILDEGSESDAFWAALGGKGSIKPGNSDSDAAHEKAAAQNVKLFRASDASGSLEVTPAGEYPLDRVMLDTKDVFIVDSGSEIFVWVGKGASQNERKNAMIVAGDYLEQSGRGRSCKATKVNEGAENVLFKEQFAKWNEMRPPSDFSKPPSSNVAKTQAQKDIDVNALMASSNPADTLVDDGSGKVEIWRIENFEKVAVPEDLYGQFYAGDSYLVRYTYLAGTKECYIIYFWQGRNSSQDEKGASALLATQMDDELGGAATQVRVVQGKEPNHFLTLFKGSMVIHSGGTASGFKNKADADSYDTDGVNLFHVKGTNQENTRAVQVEEKAGSLNSGDCFLLRTPDNVFAWFGKGSNASEQANAQKIANILKSSTALRTVDVVEEGSEPPRFWQFLGGEGPYASSKEMEEGPRDPRLFHGTNATGTFKIEEVFDFSQDDLENDDVFLLDVYTEVYVWIGRSSNDTEKKMALETAQKYVAAAKERDGRDADTPVYLVHSGGEPPMFKAAFLGWDDSKAAVFEDPYEKKLRLMREAKGEEEPAPAPVAAAPVAVGSGSADPASHKVSLADLRANKDPSVDAKRKEEYLSDDEFKSTFKMSRADFEKLKQWKKDQLKKDAKIF